MPIARRKPDPDGIIGARIAGTAARYADLLAQQAGLTLGYYARDNRDEWQRKGVVAALLIAAGAELARLAEWIVEGQERAQHVR